MDLFVRVSLGLLALPFSFAHAEALVPDDAAVARFVEAQLGKRVDEGGPGIAVLVARGDTVVYRGARGRASIELDVPLSPDHVFRIGSVTKQFAAAGLLKLIDDGKASLDDPLSKFLPDFPNAKAVTLHQLLNHTSGIKSYTGIPGYMESAIRADLDTDALVAVFKDLPADFAPGEGWAYNNSGYVLVGAVIEKIAGTSWHAWLDTALFKPLALSHTQFGDQNAVIHGQVDGYSTPAPGQVRRADYLSMSQPHAAGALVSTLDDLLRWNRALHGGKLLSAASYRGMITPEGKAADDANRYGFGIQATTVRDATALRHGGGIHGFLSHLIYLPESQISVAVLRNADGPGFDTEAFASRLAAFAIGRPYPDGKAIELDRDAMAALEGIYRLDADNARILRVVDGRLTSQRSGGAPHVLMPVGDDTFTFEDSLSYFTIERDAAGAVTGMRFFPDGEGEGESWPRTDEKPEQRVSIDLPRAARERLVGNYVAPQLSFKVFFDDAGVQRVQVPGQPTFELHAQSPTLLFITEVDASFEFAPAVGQAATATLRQGSVEIVATRE
jgi:D-alanyl-D-alanine carboxypeptidase